MSSIFISHSVVDREAARGMKARLQAEGYDSVFLDFDPEAGIAGGQPWERELYQKLQTCRALVVLCSEHSMKSLWCFAEIMHAKALGKYIFPVKIAPCQVHVLLSDRQIIDLAADPEGSYESLWHGLRLAGLDPNDDFRWNPRRPPYPGLEAFEEADAAVYFGRDTAIRETLEALERMRRRGSPRLAVVVGSSGSGKSSLVRAGVIPRLKKDPDRWLVVQPFRPGDEPLDELARSLAAAFPAGDPSGNWRALQRRLEEDARRGDEPGGSALVEAAKDLSLWRGSKDATVLVVIDQLEELFGEVSQQADLFLRVLRRATEARGDALLAVATLRSDFLGDFQTHPRLIGLQFDGVPLGPLARELFPSVIEGPAQRCGIRLEPGLVQQIVTDAQTADALPLLAFTLREMYDACAEGRPGELHFNSHVYERVVGGIRAAVARSADDILDEEKCTPEATQALLSAFLRLARVNDDAQFVRRAVPWTDLPQAVRPLLERFVERRLLVASGEDGVRTVEVAHEALFRVWPRLNDWLVRNREFLLWKKRIQGESEAWNAAARNHDFLLRGAQLAVAERWYREHRDDLTSLEGEFLQASAAAAVDSLLLAPLQLVPGILEHLVGCPTLLSDRLRELLQRPECPPAHRRRVGLALLPGDPDQAAWLGQQLFEVEPPEFVVIRDALLRHRAAVPEHFRRVVERLWRVARDPEADAAQGFRAGCALAAFDPENSDWPAAGPCVAAQLVREGLFLGPWIQALRPVAPVFLGPLREVFREAAEPTASRVAAAQALADFAGDEPGLLAELAAEATAESYAFLYAALTGREGHADRARATLCDIIRERPTADLREAERVWLGRRRAGAAITLLRLSHLNPGGDPSPALEVFQVGDDPEALTQFVHNCKARGVGPGQLLDALDRAEVVQERFALLLALGEFPLEAYPGDRRALQRRVLGWYAEDPSSAIHGATGWLLRAWGAGRDAVGVDEAAGDYDAKREWFVRRAGGEPMTFVVFDPGTFSMGSPRTESERGKEERLHRVRVPRTFAMSVYQTTVGQWRRFVEDVGRFDVHDRYISPHDRHPVNNPSWYMAVAYARWLTAQAGLAEADQCYANPAGSAAGSGEFPPDWPCDLTRPGFRLATEAEWEYACRAGTRTTFSFGSDRDMLAGYGWYTGNEGNHSRPVGELRPNLRGVFDLHGNVYEWCHDWFADYPREGLVIDRGGPEGPTGSHDPRPIRGGAWSDTPRRCRCAYRHGNRPMNQVVDLGFRVVCTVPPRADAAAPPPPRRGKK